MSRSMAEETVVRGSPCSSCKGTGLYVGRTIRNEQRIMECEACAGTGSASEITQHDVLREIGVRSAVSPGYIRGSRADVIWVDEAE